MVSMHYIWDIAWAVSAHWDSTCDGDVQIVQPQGLFL